MASPATEVDAGGRPVRVTNPDRVIYEATDHTPEVTKLMVVEYYVSVADGIMRALRDRPTALERWPKGVHEGIMLSTGYGDKPTRSTRSGCPRARPTTSRPRTSRSRRAVAPTRSARPRSPCPRGRRRWAR